MSRPYDPAVSTPSATARPAPQATSRKRVVIIGGGFAGLSAAQSLPDTDVVLIDRTNHHLFQPLLYQVATAALSPGDIAWPFRAIFRGRPHVRVLMDDVLSIDRMKREVHLQHHDPVPFDILIVAPGSRHSYFGHDAWEPYAPGLKTITDAVELRERMLLSFEEAEREGHPLTFVIVGGGPTGVELAGALAEIGRRALGPDYPSLRLDDLAIVLVEAGPRILPGFSPTLSARAARALERMGVMIRLNSPVTDIRPDGLMIGTEFLRASNILWAAGNTASPLVASLGVPQDGSGRVKVQPDLSIPGDADIFVIGDAACCPGPDGRPLPALAPVAMQQGRYVAKLIRQNTHPHDRPPFRYADRGMLSTIGRAQAVAQLGPFHFAGFFAWLLWCIVHIFFLIGFRNRMRVMLEWMWYYVTFKPGARVIYNLAQLSDIARHRPEGPGSGSQHSA